MRGGGINAATQALLLVVCIVCTVAVNPLFVVPATVGAFMLGFYAASPERR